MDMLEQLKAAAAAAAPAAFLSDLGRPTLRGVKRCPKCGTFNGTRGLGCKNKTCGAVFRDGSRRQAADAVRVMAAAAAAVDGPLFSVRARDRGPDLRGFVELPAPDDERGAAAEAAEAAGFAPSAARDGLSLGAAAAAAAAAPGVPRCHLPRCQKRLSDGILLRRAGSAGGDAGTAAVARCAHVQTAQGCQDQAVPLSLKNSVLNSLQVPSEVKQAIWLLATETTGPLVQRVTRSSMVVKCKPGPRHPLGLLHCTFSPRARPKGPPEPWFHCACRPGKRHCRSLAGTDPGALCVHFYACVCAFASDPKLSQELDAYINLGANPMFETQLSDSNVKVLTPTSELCPVRGAKKRRKEEAAWQQVGQDPDRGSLERTPGGKKRPGSPSGNRQAIAQPVEESQVILTFREWLSSVTERINQTMHYQFDGKPEPLVFHAPQAFFDALQQRISMGNKKKRLPNSTVGFVRKDALPLGTFSKYTWHITSLQQVKQIFSTPEVPLEATRSFVENRDGTYDVFRSPQPRTDEAGDASGRAEKQQRAAIRPLQLNTFLKVGTASVEQVEPTPFVVEWVPDILPRCRIGELRVNFEYGHQRNGQPEQRERPLEPTVADVLLQ
ncbi:uncharacterized protein C2orf42 homolog [Petromyzon marinus]|uniref:uncharacterized protein C2orf42 homolog n=1 Tax=Petromyzon marinus TaxID=7757 RepID=UPI003F6EEDC6